jgi:hypothetical protein
MPATSSGDRAVDAEVQPFDIAFDLADAVLRNDQHVAGVQVGKRFCGGRAHGDFQIKNFGFRQIGTDPAK